MTLGTTILSVKTLVNSVKMPGDMIFNATIVYDVTEIKLRILQQCIVHREMLCPDHLKELKQGTTHFKQ